MVGESYNAGEWGEIYALLKILDESKLYSADSDLNIIKSEVMDVIHAEKESSINNKKIYYILNNSKTDIEIYNNLTDLKPVKRISRSKIQNTHLSMLETMTNLPKNGKGSFKIDAVYDFLQNELESPKVKANSQQKSDIDLRIYDDASPKKCRDAGFSIKSEFGGDPTIFNSSGSTNIIYKINNFKNLSQSDITKINKIVGTTQKKNGKYKADVSGRVNALYKKGCSLIFDSTQNRILQGNLEGIDSALPNIYADLLVNHFLDDKKSIHLMVEDLAIKNNSNLLIDKKRTNPYEVKFKKMLSANWRGMTGGKIWENKREIKGGFIFVKTSGELVCFHIFNWSYFEDYLYKHVRLDTPSADRHKFGAIKRDGTFKLNVSIRIKF